MVGVSLLQAIQDVLGDAVTEDVINAWKEAYFFLADILIAREKEIYAA
jgi:nitric oxide dioxygenase